MGLDKVLEFLVQWFWNIVPFFVVKQWEEGIVLRLGKYHRTIGPGFHLKWPVGIEEEYTENVNTVTKNIAVQSLTTQDGVRVNIGMVVTANIEDIKASFLNVEGAEDAILDVVYGGVGTMVKTETWEQLMDPEWENRITIKCRRAAKKYGWYIQQIQVSDVVRGNSLRLFQN
jgi:membrane protease subunit HflK